MHLCDWHQLEARIDSLFKDITDNKKRSTPLPVQGLFDSVEIQKKCAEIYALEKYSPQNSLVPIARLANHPKIRIGYFSSDFCDHPVSHLLAEVLENHDKTRFEIFAFSFRSERNDSWRERVIQSVDQFIDVRMKSDIEVTMLARNLEIDIAVDLNGFTTHSRTGIFAERAAPIQASYIGYLGTMAVPYMDYLIADRTIIPEDKQMFYSEKIAYLPSYQSNDGKQKISERVFTRSELGLPEHGFVFCSFNNNYKITPEVFGIWMRILKQVPGSVLWLYVSNQTAINNLKIEAKKRGVHNNRLIFANKIPLEDHLARQKLADLFLDTHPYNAGATASNALRVGLPVLTRMGESFVSRMGASLLNAVSLPEMITTTPEEYESLAVQLATHPEQLEQIRQKLAYNLPTCELFDTRRFTRNIESAYVAMYERYQSNLPPEHLYLQTSDSVPYQSETQMKTLLHVGCSHNRIDSTTKGFNNGEWKEIRLDIDGSVNPDIVGTMTDMSLVQDKSVDAIFSSHNIEHLYPHEVPIALNEFLRVLKDDGFCVIACPDLKSVCELVAQDKLTETAYISPAGPIAPIDILYGHREFMRKGNLFMSHHCGFTEKVLRATLYANGFKSVATMSRPGGFDLWAVACKTSRGEEELMSLAGEYLPVNS